MGYRKLLIDIAGIAMAAAREHDGADLRREEYQWAMIMQEARNEARVYGKKMSTPQKWATLLRARIEDAIEAWIDGRKE